MFSQLGPTEILLILGVVLLLFGGRKLPELARGSGRALRIFKSEVKGMHDDDKPETVDGPEALDAPARTTTVQTTQTTTAPGATQDGAPEPRRVERDRESEQG